jgi:hypothetical protein
MVHELVTKMSDPPAAGRRLITYWVTGTDPTVVRAWENVTVTILPFGRLVVGVPGVAPVGSEFAIATAGFDPSSVDQKPKAAPTPHATNATNATARPISNPSALERIEGVFRRGRDSAGLMASAP